MHRTLHDSISRSKLDLNLVNENMTDISVTINEWIGSYVYVYSWAASPIALLS